MRKRILALPALALSLGLIGAAPAQAYSSHQHGSKPAKSSSRTTGKAQFFRADLNGRNEVPAANGAKVGDRDGRAVALVRVKGNRVSFAIAYKGMQAPTLGHIHQGKAGVNGDVKVPLFGTALPATVTAAAGATTVNDPAIASLIRSNPVGFYVNLHTAEFPGGAVRGQLEALKRPVDLLGVVRGGKLRAFLDGEQEVPAANGAKTGDPNGHAVAFVRAKRNRIEYSAAWVGIGAPTLGHIHQGRFGVNGDVKVGLFTTAMPDTVFAVSGTVSKVDRDIARKIDRRPTAFYVNLHTAEFPGGAVRGQLFR